MTTFTTTLTLATAVAFTAGLASAQEAPDWLGGDLVKPLSETRIGITVLYPGSNSYQAMYAETAEAYAAELGIQATVMDPQGDPAVQFDQIQDMASQNLDALVVWPTSQNALIPAIRNASRAGIPVITSNSPIGEAGRRYIESHTGPDDCALASQAADMLGDALDGEGNIVVVEGTPGYAVSILRGNCFLDRLADNYPDINVLGSQTAEWNREKAQTVTETFLTQFGDEIDGVYAFDDGMALGVVSALQGAGFEPGDVKVVSCNQFGEGWDAMREGWISGSGKQSPIDDAILAIQTAIQVANGIEVPELREIERAKITPENVEEFERPTW
ncbi:sugar ABC transporter substrate-binding protein [Ponticoccus sp. SC2-23]|uniref:sugar ABC transporter substrate-binding protein n=1 Tax=Alexandriicola marinus TaxID=2081710 RepID=UPI000FDA8F8A|nr:sugar ABC transporter substrate-binding protein [Alexandriicola marinus]MBM1218581.1 sugar ABC transporter substrate-binding protein [Ponticoccus sp. SC6-9]MBM1224347.1 sugar ABC transporter substrate-binding protein [Ponticoccus sp. SC6-15]MBM1229874.1 sugar ABC transporter substrate-binding protein [Ponticoccus sp. SC6-38]MBM1233313.1 sugar ABC transporter substrate-binding protein [Ponticoccus sp. SC6-45]MBM1236737.1 sugar ABC transporter substrate-binding protein [Ponticoccus sp. SC6-49